MNLSPRQRWLVEDPETSCVPLPNQPAPASRASVRPRCQSLSQRIADLVGIGIAEVAEKGPTIPAATQAREN